MLFFPCGRADLLGAKAPRKILTYEVCIELIYVSSLCVYFYWMIAYYFNITQAIYEVIPRTTPEILLIICFLFIFVLKVPTAVALKSCGVLSILSLVIAGHLLYKIFSPEIFWVIDDLGKVLGGQFKLWFLLVLMGIIFLELPRLWLSIGMEYKYPSTLYLTRVAGIVISIIGMINIQALVFQNRGLRFYYTEKSKAIELPDINRPSSSNYARGILEQWKK